ncbi:hypothetical protein QBZ16_004030 [Prototheca wickerhamii]|uniref:Uncharacterized protein n=1 Tax=Prototheca wickerhamii TaxID=3111 RepID=A0AAD9ILH0_PROWI|nr:hypothetical protein QBZ16_004030 [Prototheca wickerhamii]
MACVKRAVPILVQDRVDVALACAAQGVHVSGADGALPLASIKRLLSATGACLLGSRASSPEEAAAAVREGAAFVTLTLAFLKDAVPEEREAVRLVEETQRHLSERPLVLVKLLEEGTLPTTNDVIILKDAGSSASSSTQESNGVVSRWVDNSDILRAVSLGDTPGTNVVLAHQQRLARGYIPRADLILFVMSAERPCSESELRLLAHAQRWGRQTLFALNKTDLLAAAPDADGLSELESMLAFVRRVLRQVLRAPEVPLLATSARTGAGILELRAALVRVAGVEWDGAWPGAARGAREGRANDSMHCATPTAAGRAAGLKARAALRTLAAVLAGPAAERLAARRAGLDRRAARLASATASLDAFTLRWTREVEAQKTLVGALVAARAAELDALLARKARRGALPGLLLTALAAPRRPRRRGGEQAPLLLKSTGARAAPDDARTLAVPQKRAPTDSLLASLSSIFEDFSARTFRAACDVPSRATVQREAERVALSTLGLATAALILCVGSMRVLPSEHHADTAVATVAAAVALGSLQTLGWQRRRAQQRLALQHTAMVRVAQGYLESLARAQLDACGAEQERRLFAPERGAIQRLAAQLEAQLAAKAELEDALRSMQRALERPIPEPDLKG